MYVTLCRLRAVRINPKSVGRTVKPLAAWVHCVGVDHSALLFPEPLYLRKEIFRGDDGGGVHGQTGRR